MLDDYIMIKEHEGETLWRRKIRIVLVDMRKLGT